MVGVAASTGVDAYLDRSEKQFLALMFFKGALLADPEGVLEEQSRLDRDPAFKAAFEALTPGRQREYDLYFSGAKQAQTREARVESYAQKILDGKGFSRPMTAPLRPPPSRRPMVHGSSSRHGGLGGSGAEAEAEGGVAGAARWFR